MLGQQTQLGSTTIGTSIGDIIINNVSSVADGVISGFASFVHDPRSLKETISVFAKSAIPKKFADGVMLRRIETQKLDDIWSFPLNLAVSNTCPLPWVLIEATTRANQSSLQLEFNIMRTVDFVGRNYLYIRLPAIDTSNVMDQDVRTNSEIGVMEDPDHVYLGAWYRDLVPRLIKTISFYPRSNSHKLFEYSGYDIFVHNILFGNAHKEMNDLMAGEDKFELQYDPYFCDGSALGLSSFRGIDAFRTWTESTNGNETTWEPSTSADFRWGRDGLTDYFQLDTQMQGFQFREFYRKGVWYEAPVARNYHARHSIHSRRMFHQAKDIAVPLDILPFGYSVASSLPSAAIAGECGFIQVTFFEDWLDRSFYLTRVSDVPSLHPLVNHVHYDATKGDTTPDGQTLGADDPRDGWVNERSLGRFGDPTFQRGVWTSDKQENEERKLAFTQAGNIVGASEGLNQLEGIIPTKMAQFTDGEIAEPQTELKAIKQKYPRTSKIPIGSVGGASGDSTTAGFTGTGLTRKGIWNGVQKRSTVNDPRAISYRSRLVDISKELLVKMSSVDITYATQLKNSLGIKLLQVGYQSLPCVRELLSKLPNIYITTEWNDLRTSINTNSFEINNDLYIQAIVLWFMPYDSDIPQTRVYAPHMIDHELPIIAGIKLQNEQAQGNMTISSKIMNEINPAQMNLNPLMENMYLISFSPSLSANCFPHAYYDSNISGYLKMEILPGEEGTSIETCVNLTKGEYYVISIGVNGVASVNLNLFRLVF